MKTHSAVALKKKISVFPKKLNGCNKCVQTRSSYLKKKIFNHNNNPIHHLYLSQHAHFKVRMLWPEGPSVQFYKYRQKLQSQKARPSQSVTLSTLINYVHPLDGCAWRPEVLSGSQLPRPTPPAIHSPPTQRPHPTLSPLGRPGALRDGLPARPLHPWGGQARVAGSNLRLRLTDSRHVNTGRKPVSGDTHFIWVAGAPSQLLPDHTLGPQFSVPFSPSLPSLGPWMHWVRIWEAHFSQRARKRIQVSSHFRRLFSVILRQNQKGAVSPTSSLEFRKTVSSHLKGDTASLINLIHVWLQSKKALFLSLFHLPEPEYCNNCSIWFLKK